MTEDKVQTLITEAARAFDAELHTSDYAEIHADAAQLERLLTYLEARPHQSLLDLGTGAGYVALALAQCCPTSNVIGLDIARRSIERNNTIAFEKDLTNIHFQVFTGIELPFENDFFDGVISRFAFHHFPRPDVTLAELRRVIRTPGRLVIADAVRSDVDDTDFINDFQHLKQDGHVEMLRVQDLIALFERHGFELRDSFSSALSFQRQRGPEYDALIDTTPASVLDAYRLVCARDQMYLTFPIFNAVFTTRPVE